MSLDAADPLECLRQAEPLALEQELACEERSVQLAPREDPVGHGAF